MKKILSNLSKLMYTHASSHINSQTQDPYNWFSVVVADFVLLHGAHSKILLESSRNWNCQNWNERSQNWRLQKLKVAKIVSSQNWTFKIDNW